MTFGCGAHVQSYFQNLNLRCIGHDVSLKQSLDIAWDFCAKDMILSVPSLSTVLLVLLCLSMIPSKSSDYLAHNFGLRSSLFKSSAY